MARSDMPSGQPWQLYAALSSPVVVLDEQGAVVYLNPRAEAFWGVRLEEIAGRPAWETMLPERAQAVEQWMRTTLFPALAAGRTVSAELTGAGDRPRPATVHGTWLNQGEETFAVLTVTGEHFGPSVAPPPEWALRDPLTGLHNVHHWRQQRAAWNARGGALAFFDLDGLKAINDLAGHRSGDRALALTGQALAAQAPPGSLVVRCGGDEFVMVTGPEGAADLGRAAGRAVEQAGAAARAAGLPLPLHLSFGLASFAPGGLEEAVQRADEAMYAERGVLLLAEGAERIVLTREGRGLLRGPGADPDQEAPGSFAARFGPEWDGYFRHAFARAAAQAREFVDFAAPRAGEAAVEVGAGSGRLAFDGGLAERIGPRGQLLLTDPSASQLQVARRRAQELGLSWLRFLQAPVEDLPLGSGTVGLVIGSTFLHFTDPPTALRSMARLLRPGGRVAVNAVLDLELGDGWEWALEPVREAQRASGLPQRGFLAPRSDLEAACTAAGLELLRVEEAAEVPSQVPSAAIALGMLRQTGFVRLFLRGAPAGRAQAAEEAFSERLRSQFATPGRNWRWAVRWLNLLGRLPAC